MPRWRVDIIGKKSQHVGTIEAESEREALAEAIKHFEIRPALRSKIAVTKIGTKRGDTP
jgi:1,2-phenylacetyl-CoA epoxidase PaaB subunit